MSTDTDPRDRSAEFRRALVATAELAPYVRRGPSLKIIGAGLAAFALAGALTGAAVATVGKLDPELVAAQSAATLVAQGYVRTSDGVTIGHPFLRSASGTQTINVGLRPPGATALVEGFGCLDPGHFIGLIDSRKFDSFEDCSPGGSGADLLTVSGDREHVVTWKTQTTVRFAVWLSWARIPKFTDSAAQKHELADGVVSRDEDLAAFNRFAGCMAVLGHPLIRPTAGLVPGFSESNSALDDGSDNRCYSTEYRHVDAQWQIEISEGKVGAASVRACTSPAPVVAPASPQRRILYNGSLLPVLTGCAWVG
jgi:hypothetical protein